ncbi:hypothetical protein SDC9_80994 [bioreactor metagenome]|uniref:Uncharacterized protein n=1 Tax=bioreactor metagenome TaxID=1076179 RepID=A0A644Z329_9ZZZZ
MVTIELKSSSLTFSPQYSFMSVKPVFSKPFLSLRFLSINLINSINLIFLSDFILNGMVFINNPTILSIDLIFSGLPETVVPNKTSFELLNF